MFSFINLKTSEFTSSLLFLNEEKNTENRCFQ